MNTLRAGGLALAVALACTGCRSPAEMNAILAKAATLQPSPEYRVGEGDGVTIRVLGELTYQVSEFVRPDGKISFPGHGDVEVKGKTVPQIRAELEKELPVTLGLKSPTVYVAVNSFASKTVTVLGEVGQQGLFPYTGQMRVSDLLGRTRGVLITSAPNRTLLFREVEGNLRIYNVRLKDFLHKGDFSTNFYVQPGDIVFVPKNGFSKVAEKITIAVSPLGAALSFVTLGGQTTQVFVP
ncbi:MAG: polysaccharide biosynthesis/export family protein [Planctomycetota bacterium]